MQRSGEIQTGIYIKLPKGKTDIVIISEIIF